MSQIPIYKRVNRSWKTLPSKGDDVAIRDPKLKQGYLGDLQKKTILELEEIHKRTEQVLNNKSLLSKLKDRGESLRARQVEITKALQEVREKEKLAKGVLDQNDIHGFEWTGSLTNNTTSRRQTKEKQDPEEDGEDLDPLELMAHHSSSVDHREYGSSRLIEEDPAAAIARELEQMEINDSRVKGELKESVHFGVTRNEMFERKYKENGPARISFKPFRPVSNPRPVPGLVVKKKPVEMKPVICISMEESQRLEKDYLDKQKDRDLKLTIEGLTRPNKVSNICQLPSNAVGNYRDTNLTKHILDSDEEEEEEEDDGFLLGELEGTEEDDLY